MLAMKSKNPYRPLQYEERIHLICDRCLYAERMWSRPSVSRSTLSRPWWSLGAEAFSTTRSSLPLAFRGSREVSRKEKRLGPPAALQPRGSPMPT